ncbi:hypothetical protein GIY30_20065 [Gordonia sp. HNM0687]|uniref:Uncharacterized protein n=1 Tax=Gordonia mangrovi TaxID=2665643 RepID=A0A6L7GY73_9ACTN|nr:hypothetical protein [Gordonia mangrovi]MXP23638.1 hypothetical protein [Gordonia mangrovi]UVF79703.1 hypothetical protein NWF22_07685 [Gordonia mangrovi]
MLDDLDPAARAQARQLVIELERAADAIVDDLESAPADSSATSKRAELFEVRGYIQRLQQRFQLNAVHG